MGRRSLDNHARIHKRYGLDRYNISSIADWFNVADFGAKLKCTYSPVGEVWRRNRFRVGFRSRSEMRSRPGAWERRAAEPDAFTAMR